MSDIRSAGLLDAQIGSDEFKTWIPELIGPDDRFRRMLYLSSFIAYVAALLAVLFFLSGAAHGSRGPLDFEYPDLAPKPPGTQRIAYLTNSHGTTGGHIAFHIRKILSQLDPGKYEVFDMAFPGMYASEMLLRTAASQKYAIDDFVYATSYVVFADRMTLQNQAVRVRHFFRDGVALHMPIGFWLRNFDLPLFLDDAAATVFPAFKRRQENRQLWEPWVAAQLKRMMGSNSRIRSLEVDYRQAWRFPGGFPEDLFNWRLLEGRRDRQMAELMDAVRLAQRESAKVAVLNVPIDFSKATVGVNQEDLKAYSASLAEAARSAELFFDYQGHFPAEFTTYDALHPNLYGARLHALEMVLQMNESGLLQNRYDPSRILAIFDELGAEELEKYQRELLQFRQDLKAPNTPAWEWASLDLTASSYSFQWLSNLSTNFEVFWPRVKMIDDLLLHIAHLNAAPFKQPVIEEAQSLGPSFLTAFERERARSQEFTRLFLNHISEIINERFGPIVLDNGQDAAPPNKWFEINRPCGSLRILAAPRNNTGASEYSIDGKVFAVASSDAKGRRIRRTDILGDGSFLLAEENATDDHWYLPWHLTCSKNGYDVASFTVTQTGDLAP